MDIKEFAQLVQDMRKAQNNFFDARARGLQKIAEANLIASKALESKVDAAAKEILSPQSKLFS